MTFQVFKKSNIVLVLSLLIYCSCVVPVVAAQTNASCYIQSPAENLKLSFRAQLTTSRTEHLVAAQKFRQTCLSCHTKPIELYQRLLRQGRSSCINATINKTPLFGVCSVPFPMSWFQSAKTPIQFQHQLAKTVLPVPGTLSFSSRGFEVQKTFATTTTSTAHLLEKVDTREQFQLSWTENVAQIEAILMHNTSTILSYRVPAPVLRYWISEAVAEKVIHFKRETQLPIEITNAMSEVSKLAEKFPNFDEYTGIICVRDK